MSRRLPLRWLMLGPVLVSVALAFGVFAVYIESSVRRDLIAGVDDELVRAEQGRPPGGGPAGDGTNAPLNFLVSAGGGLVLDAGASNEAVAALLAEDVDRVGLRTIDTASGAYRVRVVSRPDGPLEVTALPLDGVLSAVDDLRRNLLAGGLVVFAAQALVVWRITSRATRPVTQIATSARQVAAGELDIAIEAPRGPRETAELADDLQRMLDTLRSTIAAREQAAEDADRARETMARFLADAAHELRTPLTALRGYSELYERDMLGEPGALDRAMERIGTESNRLERLVGSLLQLARGTASVVALTAPVDLAEVVGDVVDDLRAANPDRTITLTTDGVAIVAGDRERLHQAVLNLGANACEHTPVETDIEVALRREEATTELSVIDHGPGVPADDIDRIFDPFFQGDPSRASTGAGSAGLGLALTRQIIDALDGTITAHETPGGGLTMKVRLVDRGLSGRTSTGPVGPTGESRATGPR